MSRPATKRRAHREPLEQCSVGGPIRLSACPVGHAAARFPRAVASCGMVRVLLIPSLHRSHLDRAGVVVLWGRSARPPVHLRRRAEARSSIHARRGGQSDVAPAGIRRCAPPRARRPRAPARRAHRRPHRRNGAAHPDAARRWRRDRSRSVAASSRRAGPRAQRRQPVLRMWRHPSPAAVPRLAVTGADL
jgi:hypothetical protein